MKYSGIGGQALIEGIMMKNKDNYAMAVRKPNGEIAIEKEDKKFVLGIQWHPEGMLDYDEDANKIIDAFMLAVKNK